MGDDQVILAAALLPPAARQAAALRLGLSVPALLQRANRLADSPALAADPRAARLRARRDAARAARRTSGRL